MRRSWVRVVARGVIGVLLTAQLAIAAYACPALAAATATAANAQIPASNALPDEHGAADIGTPMAANGHCEDMIGSLDPSAPNLCAEHCKNGQQSDQARTLSVPAAVFSPLYLAPPVPVKAPPPRPAAATISALVAASPPHAILHCVYRI